MSVPSIHDIVQSDLFTSETELREKFPQTSVERLLRIRAMYNWLISNPESKDKEFVGEGSRWFDLVRMHDASGQPLAFSAAAAYPVKPGGSVSPVIKEEYQLLWPINTAIHSGDGTIWQTWGYKSAWNKTSDDED